MSNVTQYAKKIVTIVNSFKEVNKTEVTLEEVHYNIENNTNVRYVYTLKFKNNKYTYDFPTSIYDQQGISSEKRAVNDMLSKAQSLVKIDKKQQKEEEKKTYLATQAQAINSSISITESDKYYAIYEQYNKVINLFNSIDSSHKYVISSKYNQGFKIILANVIQHEPNNIIEETIEKIATELKKLWDVCKKNNYVVGSDGKGEGFPCRVSEYDREGKSDKKYIEYNKFRTSRLGSTSKSYNNGEILLNELNFENEEIKSTKRYFVNLLAPKKGVLSPGNIEFEWHPKDDPRYKLDKDDVIKYPKQYQTEIGAPFGVEISEEEYNEAIGEIKNLYSETNIDEKMLFQNISFLIYDDCDFGKNLIDEISNARKKVEEIEQSIVSSNEETKRDLLAEAGMPPTLGDLFKTIMCHLETFTHMIFSCSQTIYNQVKDNERTPEKLHIDLDNTDIINYDIYNYTTNKTSKTITPVTPFPGIFTSQDYSSANKDSLHPLKGQPSDGIKSMSWTGEIDKTLENKMEETLLVESIYEKITSVYNSMQESAGEEIPTSYDMMPYPILPTDLNHSLFPAYSTDRIDGLAAYLAFRISLLHYNKKNEAKSYSMTTIGEVDGFNYWETLCSKFGSDNGALNILKNINDQIGGLDKFDETIKQIVTCTSEDDRFKTDGRYIFERYAKTFGIVDTCNDDGTYNEGRGLKKTQRILSEDNIQYHYRYMEDIVDSSLQNNLRRFQTNKLIPIGIETFDELSNVVTPKRNNTGYLTFDIKSTDANPPMQSNVVICGTINHNPTGERIKDNVINNDMFRIFVDNGDKYGERAIVQIRDNIIDTFKDDDIEISGGNYKQTFNLGELRKNYFNIDDTDFSKYFGNKELSLYPNTTIQEEVTDVTDPNCIYFPTDKTSIRIPNGYINSTRNNGGAKVYARLKCKNDGEGLNALLIKDNDLLVGGQSQINGEYEKLVGNGVTDLKTLKLRDFEIYVSRDGNQQELVSLFGSQIYYRLNEGLMNEQFACDAAKAFLFLHTLKYDFQYIYRLGLGMVCIDNIDERPMVSPYGGLLLEGGLIYRYRYWKKTSVDLLSSIYDDADNNISPDDGCGLLFYDDGTINTPFIYSTEEIQKEKSKHFLYKNLAISQRYDLYTQNELLHKFEEFVRGDWQTIKEVLELKRSDGKVLSVEEFNELVATLKTLIDNNDVSDVWGILSEQIPFNNTNSTDESFECRLSNFVGNYWYIKPTPSGNLQLRVYEGNTLVNDLFYNIYLSKILVSSTVGYNTSTTLSIGKSAFDNYLNGFKKTIMGIYNANSEVVTEEPHQEDTTQLDKNVDLRIGIYMYIKNLWDRWLLHNNNMGDIIKDNPYSVRNYFSNFVFCDSFYRNMYNMTINMEHAAQMISNDHVTDAPKSLHSYLGDIACENKCMFLALPDTVDLGNPDTNTAISNMNSMFVPYTWREKRKIRQENTFMVMHCYTDSGVIGEQQETAGEGFDLYAFEDGKNVASVAKGTTDLFKRLIGDKERELNEAYKKNPDDPFYRLNMQKIRYGYNVPSFGVAFSRQNNSIFKNINVNMDTPMVTEVYSKTYEDIINKASGNTAHVTFYGQDIYPVFQNYSYQCEVEMMGNAQITPMMYIQLLNIPLFNGAYMITSVQHDMKPGYMTTKFKAIKMSKRCPRYVDSAYVETNGAYGGVSGGGSAGGGTYIDTSYGISYGCNGFDITKAKQGGYNYKGSNMPKIVKEMHQFSGCCVGGVHQMFNGGLGKAWVDTTPNYGWAGYSAYIPFEDLFLKQSQLYELVAYVGADGRYPSDAPDVKNNDDRKKWNEWFSKTEYYNKDCCVMFMTHGQHPPKTGDEWNRESQNNQQLTNELYSTRADFNSNNFTDKTREYGHGVWWDAQSHHWVSDVIQTTDVVTDGKGLAISGPICYNDGAKYWRLYALRDDCNGNGKKEITSNINATSHDVSEEQKRRGEEVMRLLHKNISSLTPVQAAGIAGVWGHESGGWNPEASASPKSSAFGLAQWLKIRTGGSESNPEGDFVKYMKSRGEEHKIEGMNVAQVHDYFKTNYNTIEKQVDFAVYEMTEIPQFKENSGNKCNVLGSDANYNTPTIYNTGNILSVNYAPYLSDKTFEGNKTAIHDVIRRFLLGYEMQNQPPKADEVKMESRLGWAKIAFEIAMQKNIWS